MPSVTASDDKFVGVYAVYDDGIRNDIALLATTSGAAGYTVDWGDGTVENVASNTQANHAYTYADIAAPGAGAPAGVRYVVVTVTPQSGGAITSINLQRRAPGNIAQAYFAPWLDIACSHPSATSVAFGGTTVTLAALERWVGYDLGAVASLALAWYNCYSLQVWAYSGAFDDVTSISNAFANCSSFPKWVQSIDFPSLQTASNAWFGCLSMRYFIHTGTFGSCTNFTSMLHNCFSLVEFVFAGSLGSATSLASFLRNCSSLLLLKYTGGALSALSNTSGMLTGANSLQSVIGTLPSISFSVENCNMDPTQLEALFDDLPTVSGQTLTITGNPGAATADTTAAVAAGWTVAA